MPLLMAATSAKAVTTAMIVQPDTVTFYALQREHAPRAKVSKETITTLLATERY